MYEDHLLAARRTSLSLSQRSQNVLRACVVTERFTYVDEQVFITRSKDEAAAELEGILAQLVLFVSGGLRALTSVHVVATQEMEQGSVAQLDGFVGFAFFIDQQRELDAGLFTEEFGVAEVAQADRGKARTFLAEFLFMLTQLRDVFAAEDSTVMAEKDQRSRTLSPKRAEKEWVAVDVRERDCGKPGAEAFSHGGILRDAESGVKSVDLLSLPTMRELKDSVAVITGAGSGIGRALAVDLARRGAKLALADVNSAGLEETRRLVGAAEAHTYSVDVSKAATVEQFAAQVQRDFGRTSLLVNNAGVALFGTFAEVSLEDMEWLIQINFWGVVYGCKFFLPMLEREPDAHIVNISSIFGLIGPPGQTAYSSSKFAVRGFSESLREELRATSNIKVTSVHPAGIATPIAERARAGTGSDAGAREKAKALFKKVATIPPEEAARVIVRGILANKNRVLIGRDAYRIDRIQRLFPNQASRLYADALAKRAGEPTIKMVASPGKSASRE